MGFAQGKRNYSSKEVTSQIADRYDTAVNNVVGAINASHFDAGIFIHGMQAAGGNIVSFPTLTWPKEAYVLQEVGRAVRRKRHARGQSNRALSPTGRRCASTC